MGASIISTVIVICIETWWAGIPEFWEYGYETGRIVSNLLLAFVASFIFYWVVVYDTEQKERKKVNKTIKSFNQRVVTKGFNIYRIISIGAQHRYDPSINIEMDKVFEVPTSEMDLKDVDYYRFLELYKKIVMQQPTNSNLVIENIEYNNATIGNLLHYSVYEFDKDLNKLLSLYTVLDSDHRKLLINLSESRLLVDKELYYLYFKSKIDMDISLYNMIFQCFERVRELQKYHNKHFN